MAESPAPAAQSALTAQVLDPNARIYAQRDPFSATLWLGRVGDVYDLSTKSGDWYEVALPDGRTGWIVGQHVVVMPARAARSLRAVAGSGREILGAVVGTLVGGTVTGACLIGAFALDPPFDGLFMRVHGSGTVTRTMVYLALGATVASYALTPAAAAYGAYTMGETNRPGGNMWASWVYATAGGVAGTGLGIGLDALVNQIFHGTTPAFTILVGGFGTTAGAVIGYEKSKPRYAQQYGWTRHVSPPTFGLSMDTSTPGQTSPALRLNLVALRF
jgi:uncharacterized protein YgiM (DUF1202 family)